MQHNEKFSHFDYPDNTGQPNPQNFRSLHGKSFSEVLDYFVSQSLQQNQDSLQQPQSFFQQPQSSPQQLQNAFQPTQSFANQTKDHPFVVTRATKKTRDGTSIGSGKVDLWEERAELDAYVSDLMTW